MESMDLGGILCFVADRRTGVRQLRVFDINNYRLVLQVEVYANMHLHLNAVQPNFYCFPLPFMVLGIEFASLNDAQLFDILVNKYCLKIGVDEHLDDVKERIKELHKGSSKLEEGLISRPFSFSRKETAWFNPVTQTFNID